MPAKASDIDKTRRRCGVAALELLATRPPGSIDTAAVADAAKADPEFVSRLFPDRESLIDQGLRDRDEAILLRLGEDFEADPDASVREKILEGLIARFEDYTPVKEAIRHLVRTAATDPALGMVLVRRLNGASKSLLSLAGVGTRGLAGMLRIKGLSGVALSCQREWLRDDSPDLAATTRMLDSRLKQAEGLARGLNLLDPGALGGTVGGGADRQGGSNDRG